MSAAHHASRGALQKPEALRALIAAEISRPAPGAAAAMAARLMARPGALAVLCYGAWLREGGGRGPLDLYVLTESDSAWHGPGLAALANRLLPPNVYHEVLEGPPRVDAKVAVVSLRAFRARMDPRRLDTTFWARFCQPCVLVAARSEAVRAEVVEALAMAAAAAAHWALRLSPDPADAAATWRALFRATYGSELRVEGAGRADSIIAADPERWCRLHALLIAPAAHPRAGDPSAALAAWRRRRLAGKALNLLRLVKAAFTYRGGFAYALAKVERHSGRPVELRDWERRWPWLAAPVVMWRLWREGRLR